MSAPTQSARDRVRVYRRQQDRLYRSRRVSNIVLVYSIHTGSDQTSELFFSPVN